jgi:lysozyme
MVLEGRDVSHYDGTAPDYSGLSFVIAKATQGLHYVDKSHNAHVTQARGDKLVLGSYHFLEAGNGGAQCDKFLATVAAVDTTNYLYAFDVERYGDREQYHPAHTDVEDFHTRFHVRMPDRLLHLYSYASFWSETYAPWNLNCPRCRLWSASYGGRSPRPYGGFPEVTLHQYTATPHDSDRYYGSLPQLMLLASPHAINAPPMPTPKPKPPPPVPGVDMAANVIIHTSKAKGVPRGAALIVDGRGRPLGSDTWTAWNEIMRVDPQACSLVDISTANYDALVPSAQLVQFIEHDSGVHVVAEEEDDPTHPVGRGKTD